MDGLLRFRPGRFHHADIFRIGLLGSHFHEAASHLLHYKLVAKSLDRIQFAVVPGTLEKLQHQDPHALAHRP